MYVKFLKTYAILLVLSLAANYLMALVFESLNEPEATFLHTLYWAAIILLIPFAISLALSGIYKLVKRSSYKYYWHSVWLSWAVIYIIPFTGMYVLQS